MSEELKPCPFCGSDDLDGEFPLIECLRCGCEGPSNWTEGGERRVCDWNTRSPALTWTFDRPTVPGWYWVESEHVEFTARYIDRARIRAPDPFPSGMKFAGPIPEPAEPAKEGGVG